MLDEFNGVSENISEIILFAKFEMWVNSISIFKSIKIKLSNQYKR